jgi:Ca2+-binding RTX toxin-like protein
MSRRRVAVTAAVLATGALLASASAASAARIEVIDGTAVFTAGSGERNNVRAVTRFPVTMLTVSDTAPLHAGHGCRLIAEDTATCDEDPLAPRPLVVSTRDRGDNVLIDDDEFRQVTVHSGSGNDHVDVGSRVGAPALLDGGSGDDELTTRENSPDNPILKGGDGDDVLTLSEAGGGQAYGGDGDDRLVFAARLISGPPLLLDGGDGNDTYKFTQQLIPTSMVAGSGFDTLDEGGPIAPFAGIDFDMSTCPGCVERVIGTATADHIAGDGRSQVIFGGAGDDQLEGGGGSDVIAGEAGNDIIDSDDGIFDVVSCGADLDTVTSDSRDLLSRDCETLQPPV